MSWQPETKEWPDNRAVLFVHGIGNSKPGDTQPGDILYLLLLIPVIIAVILVVIVVLKKKGAKKK